MSNASKTSTYRSVVWLSVIVTSGFFVACGGGSGGGSGGGALPPGPGTVTSISPESVQAGSESFILTLRGTNLKPNCPVLWNLNNSFLSALPTTYISSSELQAQVSAELVANIGFASVGANCASVGLKKFLITGFPRRELNVAANDIIWDAMHQVFYLSVPPTVPGGDSIAVFDPTTGTVLTSLTVGSNPDILAISGDSQFLYIGLDDASSILRLKLPGLTNDMSIPVGPSPIVPSDIKVAPGFPRTIAVALGNRDSYTVAGMEGVTVFDDDVARPSSAPPFAGTGYIYSSIQWGAAPTVLYAANGGSTGFDFYSMPVDENGVTTVIDYPEVFHLFNPSYGNRIHFVPATGLLYSDNRNVVDPTMGTEVWVFPPQTDGGSPNRRMVPDANLNVAFLMYQSRCVFSGVGTCYTVEGFNLTNYDFINSLTMSSVQGEPINMVRWGQSGLAFNTDTGQIYLVDISTLLQPAAGGAIQQKGPETGPSSLHRERIVTTTRRRVIPDIVPK